MPDSAEQRKARALALVQEQKFSDARKVYDKLCETDPGDLDAWYMLGAVNAQLGMFDEAIDCCQRVLKLNPAHTRALYNLAQVRMHKGDFSQAIKDYGRLLEIDPAYENARNGLKHAESMLNTRHPKVPGKGGGNPEQLFGKGRRFQQRGEWQAAYDCYRLALVKEPNAINLLTCIGFVCHMLKKYEEAAGYHERALAIDPALIGERYNLAICYKELLRFTESAECYQQVLNIQPDNVSAIGGLGLVKILQGHAGEADQILRRAIQENPGDLASRSCLLLAMNYWSQDPGQLFHEHVEWDRHCPQSAMRHKPQLENEDRPLRIGYVSPDLCSHPVAFFIEPLLARHDRSSFEVFCYSDVAHPDGITAHLQRLVPAWRDVQGMTDDELAGQIRRDRIDILVDLAGHTAGNRLEVFARKPAPVQVSWLGYPNTSGLAAMDYRLTDAWADPPGDTEHAHSEILMRLPDGFLCYRPLQGTTVTAPPCLTTGHVTFGSFNNLAKVTPEVIAAWSQLLRRLPTARLLLKTKPLRDKDTQETIYAQFAGHSVARGRVELIGWVEKMSDHLGLYGQVDIALDTFPYNGTTTTCEGLWMGVPVITLAGRTHAGRVGVSLLSRTGLSEFIAGDVDDYIEMAAQLAGDRERLERLRNKLRGQVAASSLCDAESFARNVEASYRTMWEAQKRATQGAS